MCFLRAGILNHAKLRFDILRIHASLPNDSNLLHRPRLQLKRVLKTSRSVSPHLILHNKQDVKAILCSKHLFHLCHLFGTKSTNSAVE